MTLHTLREAPNDAEAVSHKLLVRGGYIRRLASGIYSYLPLGFRVLSKVSGIVREEFDRSGAEEILLPALHPRELWQQTGRLEKMADVLMEVDTKGGPFVLGPTHEEAVISAFTTDLASYKDLPATVYQIQTKFRDEPRSRFGLMRTKEFIMADAYSFDCATEGMRESYSLMYDAYLRIFSRLGIPVVPVEADSGSIGGDVNHEYMCPSPIGEDHFAQCVSCGYAANIEAARTRASQEGVPSSSDLPMTAHFTGDAPGVSQAVAALIQEGEEVTNSTMLKCIAAMTEAGAVALLLVPGDREVRLSGGMRLLSDEELRTFPFLTKGYIGPMGMQAHGVRVVADYSVVEGSSWATGANKHEYHVTQAVAGRDFLIDEYDSLVVVRDGDPCPRCTGTFALVRAVEVGHTFQLGTTYSTKIPSARFAAETGKQGLYHMGCYGIGVTRLIAVIVEHFADDKGIRWPMTVAPYQVVIIPVGHSRSQEVKKVAEELYLHLLEQGVEVLIDDRDVSPGIMFADAELLGVPYQLTVGSKGLALGTVELKSRMTGESRALQVEQAATAVKDACAS